MLKHIIIYIGLAAIGCGSLPAQFSSTAYHIAPGASLPATCNPANGDVWFKTSATIAVYYCSATNTWTAIGGGGGGGTPSAPANSVQFNNAGSFGGDSGITITGTPKALVGANSGSCFGSLAVANNDATFPYFDSSTGLCVAEHTGSSTWDYNAFLSYVLMDSTNHNAQAQVSEVEIENGLVLSGNRRIQVHEVWIEDQGATGTLASSKWLRIGGNLNVPISGNIDIFHIDPGIGSTVGGDFTGLNFAVNPSGVITGDQSAIRVSMGTAGAATAHAMNIAALGGVATDAAAISVGDWSNGGAGRAIETGAGLIVFGDLVNTGAATGKKVVCVDTATGRLYASSSGVACAN